MRKYGNITFCEGLICSLTEFKKIFSSHLKGLSDKEVKEAHKVAIKGNVKLSGNSTKSDKADTSKDND